MKGTSVSPELALIDLELRSLAVATLPRLEPFDFLRLPEEPRRHPDLNSFAFLGDFSDAETFRRQPSLLQAAAVYLVASILKAVALDAAFVLAVAAIVLLLNDFG